MFGTQEYDIKFFDRKVRHAFIRKVFSIVLLQFLLTFAVVAFCVWYTPFGPFVKKNFYLFIIALVCFLFTYICLVCCEVFQRTVPLNFFCLLAMTLSMAFLTGLVAARYKVQEVGIAFGITIVLCFTLILFACQTKIDFTTCCVLPLLLFVAIFCLGIAYFFTHMKVLHMVYLFLGILLYSIYLVIEVQMIFGGRHEELSPEDYILASILIYIDILQLFLCILELIGLKND